MLPLELKIKGFYSYQEEQIIDFEALTQAGLFGIFGNVGSGKSSILEAIGFVLYSETERLNNRDGRAYNMLNLKSNEAILDFTFLNFEERKFKFTARWTRNKNNFEDAGNIRRLAYEWIDSKWIPLESANAFDIIGLSYENFRRTIIIPQGQFKEFLELKGKERSEMMKAIFNLQQFDLGGKVSYLSTDNRNKQNELEGKLSVYETVSKEIITDREVEIAVLITNLTSQQKELEVVEAEINILNTLKEKFLQLEILDKKFNELKVEKPAIDQRILTLNIFEKTEKCFKSNLEKSKDLNRNLGNLQTEVENLEQKKVLFQKEIDLLNTEITVLKPKYDQLEESKKYAAELDSILKVKTLENSTAELQISIENDNKNILWIDEQFSLLSEKLNKSASDLQNLKSQKIDTNLLLSLDNWYSTAKNQKENTISLSAEIDTLTTSLENEKKQFSSFNLSSDTWKKDLSTKRITVEAEVDLAQKEQQSLLVSNELAAYASRLQDGNPCPLCGSEHHPSIMHIDDVSEKLQICNASLNDLRKQLTLIAQHEKDLSSIETKIQFINSDKAAKELILSQRKAEIQEHRNLFVWKDFEADDSSNFTAKKQLNQKVEADIKLLEEAILKVQHQLEVKKDQKEQVKTKLSTVQNSISENNGALKNEIAKLSILKVEDFTTLDQEVIAKRRDNLVEGNRITKINYEAKSTILVEKSQLLATNLALIATKTTDCKNTETQCDDLAKVINQLLLENSFANLDEVLLVLNQQIDTEKERKAIEEFAINFQSTNNQLELLKVELQGKQFDQSSYAEKNNFFQEKRQIVAQLIGENQSKKDQIQSLKLQLLEKEALLVQYEYISKRAHNLGILAGLFQANGFVNYVSTIYLQNLCDVANVRFHRMTKNHLSLMINDKNEFDVIDYLNNGSKRSVKTLSGGQLFQASLCLALALAESVQSLSKGDKNFFFIDEGFGTQDQESIAIVFETLQTLYKENRIVGIISHVAEMKESIPRSITVEKDPERGSLIKSSWE